MFFLRIIFLTLISLSSLSILDALRFYKHKEKLTYKALAHISKEKAGELNINLNEVPAKNNESIIKAIKLFNIEVPSNTEMPFYDEKLTDRAVTTFYKRNNIFNYLTDKIEVKIGPAAFSSWGILGSSIAHEVEIHCNQNPFNIIIKDKLNLDGTINAEKDAYNHEIKNAKRFGLTYVEMLEIKTTMNYYYGE